MITHCSLVKTDDPSAQAVLDYAVGVVKVNHVIIVGHTKCGGVKAAWEASTMGQLTLPWLAPLVELSKTLGLDDLPEAEALPILTEENVKQQVHSLKCCQPRAENRRT